MEKMPDIIHSSWHSHLEPLFNDSKMKILKYEILPEKKFYPAKSDIFKVFSMPLNSIKVVILGQDPYPNGEAIGLAFAVKENISLPASLKVIKSEVYNSWKEGNINLTILEDNERQWKTLNHWVEQGIFLLNTALTVEAKKAGSHLGYWEWFVREVISVISTHTETKPVWMLWGAKAQSFKGYITNYEKYNPNSSDLGVSKTNFGLQAPHPAAELYNENSLKFTGCNHFALCNKILKQRTGTVINW